jgi:glutathione S-transferase
MSSDFGTGASDSTTDFPDESWPVTMRRGALMRRHTNSRPGPPVRCSGMRLYDYSASGNCYKPRLLLALLGREYERVPVDIFAGDTLTDAFAALNPARETPVLELDDGTVVTQSSAIVWLLGEGTPWLPSDPVQRAQVVQWLCFEQERVMGGIGGARFRLITGRDPDVVPGMLARGRSALEMLDAHLSGREWLVGDACTIADVANFAYAHLAAEAGLPLAGHPAVRAWLDRVRALPGFADDLAPYPGDARAGAGRSIYD